MSEIWINVISDRFSDHSVFTDRTDHSILWIFNHLSPFLDYTCNISELLSLCLLPVFYEAPDLIDSEDTSTLFLVQMD
jgi:hypothetical protein